MAQQDANVNDEVCTIVCEASTHSSRGEDEKTFKIRRLSHHIRFVLPHTAIHMTYIPILV